MRAVRCQTGRAWCADASRAGLESSEISIAVRNDDIFLGDFCGHAIRVYPRTGNGDVAPLRVLTGPATGLDAHLGLAVF